MGLLSDGGGGWGLLSDGGDGWGLLSDGGDGWVGLRYVPVNVFYSVLENSSWQ